MPLNNHKPAINSAVQSSLLVLSCDLVMYKRLRVMITLGTIKLMIAMMIHRRRLCNHTSKDATMSIAIAAIANLSTSILPPREDPKIIKS